MKTKTTYLKIGGHRRDGKRVEISEVDPEIYEQLKNRRYSVHSGGYAYRWQRTKNGREMRYLHREVMELAGQKPGRMCVDHINGDKLDNRLHNLRLVTREENAQNIRMKKNQGGSVFRGVRKVKNGWQATVRGFSFGIFSDEIDAALKAQEARNELMPFANPDPELVKLFSEDLDKGYQLTIPGF